MCQKTRARMERQGSAERSPRVERTTCARDSLSSGAHSTFTGPTVAEDLPAGHAPSLSWTTAPGWAVVVLARGLAKGQNWQTARNHRRFPAAQRSIEREDVPGPSHVSARSGHPGSAHLPRTAPIDTL